MKKGAMRKTERPNEKDNTRQGKGMVTDGMQTHKAS